jgi:hypothetical protein
MQEVKFVGGPMHGKVKRMDSSVQSSPASIRGRPGVDYVRRTWLHRDGSVEFLMVLNTLSLGEASVLTRFLMATDAEPAQQVF